MDNLRFGHSLVDAFGARTDPRERTNGCWSFERPLADLESRLLFALSGGLGGGANELAHGGAVIAPPPRDGELAGLNADHGTADDPWPRVDADIPFSQEYDAVARCHRFEGLVGRAGLGADPDRVAPAVFKGEPMVAERPSLLRQGHERLLEQVGHLYRPAASEPMSRGKGDVLSLNAEWEHLDLALGAGWEPDERNVGAPVEESVGRVRPYVRAKREPPLGAQLHKTRRDVLIETAADARLEADLEQLAFLARALSRGGKRLFPVCEQLLGRRKQRLACSGQLDATAVAAKQGKAELSLELSDLLRERGLGNPQALGRAREMKLLCHRREITEVAKVHIHSQ
jgi:hypothetical protein